MTIQFKQMPSSRRTPGQYTELNTAIANRGLTTWPIRVLFIGQRLSGGDVDEKVLKQVFSGGDGRDYFGRGSVLGRMIDAAFDANPYLMAWAIGLDDDGAAVQATQTITFSGTATKAGVVDVWIAGERVSVAFDTGDAAADIAADLADNYLTTTENPDLPMTGEDAAAVVTLTARNGGTQGEYIDVHVETTPGAGISAVVATGVNGATDPDIQDALDLVPTEDYDFIVSGLNDATNLGKLETHLDDLVHPLLSLGAIGVFGTNGSYSDASTLSANFSSSGYMSHGFCLNTPTWAPEVAARYGAVLAAQSDPALPYNHLAAGVMPPWDEADKLTSTEVESALWAGVSPLTVGAGEKVRIVRAITTYTENDAGAADDALLDVTAPRTLFWLRKQINAMLATKYPQDKNTQLRRDSIRQDILALLFEAESLEIVENVEDNADGVVVEVNGSDPTRCDYVVPADIVDGLHILAGRIDLTR